MTGDGDEKRQHPRYEIPLKGTLLTGRDEVPCDIRNLSAGGALIEANASIRPGHYIDVEVPEIGRLSGRVTRVVWKFAGLALERGQKEVEAYIVEWLENAGPGAADGGTDDGS